MNLLCPECGSIVNLYQNRQIVYIKTKGIINTHIGYICPSCKHVSICFDVLTEGEWKNKKRTELIDKIIDN
jgi:transcription initiation factor IIE alpha subunit